MAGNRMLHHYAKTVTRVQSIENQNGRAQVKSQPEEEVEGPEFREGWKDDLDAVLYEDDDGKEEPVR
ncbi:unnamed protein product [Bursaphelenchus xylophilus]|uniref:(pine wood nematode) hypothetical protein n=1 Tax=Bursaphelenchus xylophilus TaxID=6326 RepID=A0A1I7STC9_BURXY|nr:unnamed protein product [Bursaphelenchus xylophilus]CAG9108563.1 unnamed protein product [Bursaphelenchus xylophilus]